MVGPPLERAYAAGEIGLAPMNDVDHQDDMARRIAPQLADEAIVTDPQLPVALQILGIGEEPLARIVERFKII